MILTVSPHILIPPRNNNKFQYKIIYKMHLNFICHMCYTHKGLEKRGKIGGNRREMETFQLKRNGRERFAALSCFIVLFARVLGSNRAAAG